MSKVCKVRLFGNKYAEEVRETRVFITRVD